MLIKQIKELYDHEDYNELEQLLTRTSKLELVQAFSNLDNNFILQLIVKISPSASAEIFIKLNKETQHMIVNELNYIQFKHIANELLDNPEEYEKMNKAANPYGDGKASQRIVQAIKYYFGVTEEPPVEF